MVKGKTAAQDTRVLIMDKARELFLAHGYHETSMRAIAAAAGITTGPLYFYFQNKLEVFLAICFEGLEKLRLAYREAALREEPASIRLREIYRVHQKFYHQEHQYFQIINLAFSPLAGINYTPSQKEALFKKKLALLSIKEQVIQSGIAGGEIRPIDAPKFSLFLDAVSEGIFNADLQGLLGYAGLDVDQMIEEAIYLIGLSMLYPEPPQ